MTSSNKSHIRHSGVAVMKRRGMWSVDEHNRFLEALRLYPQGPWRAITEHVGSRSIRQVQTHAQKYQEVVSQRLNGEQMLLRRDHRIDLDALGNASDSPKQKSVNPASPQSVCKLTLCSMDLADVIAVDPVKTTTCSNVSPTTTVTAVNTTVPVKSELPSLDESLDFFISCFDAPSTYEGHQDDLREVYMRV